jgi:hypothetical protein
MTDKTDQNTESVAQGQQVERAFVSPDGTITISGCEANLTSVDVADVDLLLGFADGTFVIIPNGALDALSDTPHKVVFVEKEDTAFDEAHFNSDHQTSLSDLFKMVGTTDSAKAGSLRVVSEHVDADQPGKEVVTVNDDAADDIMVVKVSDGGTGTGGDPLIPSTQLIPTVSADPVAPEILQRPSVFTPGKVTKNVAPAIWLDPNVTSDDIVNLAESDPANMITISGQVGGTAVKDDNVTVTIGGSDSNPLGIYSVDTPVLDDMTFSVDIPGNLFVDSAFPDVVDVTITASDGKTASKFDQYRVDVTPPELTIVLDSVTTDDIVNMAESNGVITISGTVSESQNDDLAGEQVTLTIDGDTSNPIYGVVKTDGTSFSIDVPGMTFAPTLGVEGITGTIEARIDSVDIAGNAGFAVDSDGVFSIDTLAPTLPVITVDDITSLDGTTPNTVNIVESESVVVVTGSVTGAPVGTNVVLNINNTNYEGFVRSDGTFSISVFGSDLNSDPDSSINANVTIYDLAGNSGTGSVDKIYDVDIERPTATIVIDDAVLNVGDSALVTITFDNEVRNFSVDDLTVENGTLVGFNTLDNVTWNATLIPESSIDETTNIITLNNTRVEDLAGNAGVGTSISSIYAVDTTPPAVADVSVSDAKITDADAGKFDITVKFNEKMDTAADPTLEFSSDISASLINGSGVWSAGDTIYTVTYDIIDNNADLSDITIDVTGAKDARGNDQLDYAVEIEFSIDTMNPTVVNFLGDNIDGVVSSADSVVNYTLTFSEEVLSISASDLEISGGLLTSGPLLAADRLSATFTVTAENDSVVDLSVTVTDSIVDLNGNKLIPASNILAVDTLNPTVLIGHSNIDGVVSDVDNVVNYTLTFSKEIASIDASDLSIYGGTLTIGPILSVDGFSATFTVVADGDSVNPLFVTVHDTILDTTGRSLVQADHTLTVDTVNPTVINIGEDNSDGTVSDLDNVVEYTLTFSEEVTSILAADLDVTGGTITVNPVLSLDRLSATFSVTASDDSDTSLSVTVNNTILDLNGNPLDITTPPTLDLAVDTINPIVEKIEMTDIMVSDVDTQVGVVVTFSKPMDTNTTVAPTLIFSPDIAGSLVGGGGTWFSFGTQLLIFYGIADKNIDLSAVTIDVVGGQDVNGNVLLDYNPEVEFGIDTLNPTVLTFDDDNDDGEVSDADNVVNYTLTFSEEVTSLIDTDLTITGGNLTGGPILAVGGLSATFQVTADDESTANLSVTVNPSVVDVNGNRLVIANNTLPVDTVDYLPNCKATLYTSSEFKVSDGTVGTTVQAGSYVDTATIEEQALASSPAGQATRERIDGTSGGDTIGHNFDFSGDVSQWSKTLHIDFSVYDELTKIELIADPAISGILGFSLEGSGIALTGPNTWTLNPGVAMSTALLASGLYLDIVYNVTDTGGPIDFTVALNVTGNDGGVEYIVNKTLDMTWRDAVSEIDFDLTSGGDQVMVLPSEGLGVDIYAGDGIDTVNAGAGNDTLVGGADGDFLDGGAGIDTASFEGSVDGVIASLATGLGTAGDADGDTYTNIENLLGSDNADILIGDGGDNVLTGADGDDILVGGAALTGDTLIGGLGNDTASYADAGVAVNASLLSGSGYGGDAEGDIYSGIENLTGGDFADTLIGDGNDNVLIGGGGGDDMQGGGGIDTASYAGASQGVIAALESSLFDFQTNDALGDTFAQIENLIGTSQGDSLYGNSSDNILDGGLGNDKLYGFAGNDNLYADQGNDIARGDIGNDTIHVSSDGANLPDNVDGGAGNDTMVLYDLGGTYDFTDLAGLDSRLENLETLDIRESSDSRADVDTNISITGLDVQNMVDDGAASVLVVRADIGDSLDLSALGVLDTDYTVTDISGGTEYSIITGDLATIQWITG